MAENRDNTGRFVKGRSGNPNGRPKVPTDVKKMLKDASKEAAQLLIDTVGNERVVLKYRLDAAKEILNRVYGKASQPIDGELDTTVRILLDGAVKDYAE